MTTSGDGAAEADAGAGARASARPSPARRRSRPADDAGTTVDACGNVVIREAPLACPALRRRRRSPGGAEPGAEGVAGGSPALYALTLSAARAAVAILVLAAVPGRRRPGPGSGDRWPPGRAPAPGDARQRREQRH